MKKLCFLLMLSLAFNASAKSAFELAIEIPVFDVSEYHAPYVATWIETENRETVLATSLWYDDQTKWLKDIRQWWRKTGRRQQAPYDGVTGATRRPGMHTLRFKNDEINDKLTPGRYVLLIEAAREVGGREVLKLPFEWPSQQAFSVSAQGQSEMGKVTLTINPEK
ncbi:DUF2271 domain-containing protein [Marinicella rhabdoformis]|uniref:DUF2271 domain-containing protein n=1 Tax=Marinicella rhabdoformis TaxID=2580566 RepID=UPI0012AECC09|nr:DUF2271 domain-containing protein [Marinicella rhabdoformis]